MAPTFGLAFCLLQAVSPPLLDSRQWRRACLTVLAEILIQS